MPPRRRQLPPLSHLQFLVLGVLLTAEEPGRRIRDVVGSYGVRRTGAAFYQLMARLERDGLLEGWYVPLVVGDQPVRERRYRITSAGAHAWRQTQAFYEAVSAAAALGSLSNA
jgi:DNA-binding PadR family transcriptional regulator